MTLTYKETRAIPTVAPAVPHSERTLDLTRPGLRLSQVAPFFDEGSNEHAALEALVGRSLSSDSAALRALVLLGIRHVRDVLLEGADNAAVDAGDFDQTAEWVEQTTAAPRRRRPGD